jgi:hypothetical protein
MPDPAKIDTNPNPDKQIVTEDFESLCRQRVTYARDGKLTWPQAIDSMQAYAFTRDIIEVLGQDAVQEIMAQSLLMRGQS